MNTSHATMVTQSLSLSLLWFQGNISSIKLMCSSSLNPNNPGIQYEGYEGYDV